MNHGFKSEKLKALFHDGKQLNYQKNATVIRAREIPRGVYLIEDGIVKVYSLPRQGNEHVHHFFGPGDFFPIIWPFRQSIRSMYYETLSPATFWVIPRETFQDFLSANPETMSDLLGELVDRYHIYTGRIDNLLYSDARERTVYQLLALADRFGIRTDAGVVIEALITHEDLAHSINMTRETFGRCIARLQQKQTVGYDDQHRIIIKDLSALSRAIGEDETKALWPGLSRFTPEWFAKSFHGGV